MIEMLVAVVGKLTDEVVHLKSDSIELKHILDLRVLSAGPIEVCIFRRSKEQVDAGSSSLLTNRRTRFPSLAEAKNFSPNLCVQTNSEARPDTL
jgi:hypothetical protein